MVAWAVSMNVGSGLSLSLENRVSNVRSCEAEEAMEEDGQMGSKNKNATQRRVAKELRTNPHVKVSIGRRGWANGKGKPQL